MKKTIFSCVLVLALVWNAAADGLFETVVRASGGTQEAALANAIDEAIRKNLGTLLSGSEELAGDRLKERLVQFSRGTATRYEVLETVQNDDGVVLTVKVTVDPQAVRAAARTLREGGSAGGVECRSTPLLDAGQDSLNTFFQSAFQSLDPARFLDVRVEDRALDVRKGVLTASVVLTFNEARFVRDLAEPLARILDGAANAGGLGAELMEEYKTPEERNAAVFYLLGDNASFRAWTLPAAFLDAVRRGARLGDLGKLPLRTHRRAWLHFSLRDASGAELERLPVPLNLSNVALFSDRRNETGNPWFFTGIIEERKGRSQLSLIAAPLFGAAAGRGYAFFRSYRQPFEFRLSQSLLTRVSDVVVSLELER